jgi:hypothetical protein
MTHWAAVPHAVFDTNVEALNLTKDEDTVASDALDGAAEIGVFLKKPRWKVYELAAKNTPGIYKEGRSLRGSKSILRQRHFERAAAGE